MAIATALGFLSVVFYVATNPAVEVLFLSEQYGAATTDAQKMIFLSAGQAMLAIWQGTAFQVAYLAGSIAGIAIGAVMLRDRRGVFGKAIASLGILGNAIGLGLYVPTVGVYISVFSVFFLEVWYILIARRLLQLGSSASN